MSRKACAAGHAGTATPIREVGRGQGGAPWKGVRTDPSTFFGESER